MNSDTAKPEKFDHLHLVYHFTVPLKKSVSQFHLKDKIFQKPPQFPNFG